MDKQKPRSMWLRHKEEASCCWCFPAPSHTDIHTLFQHSTVPNHSRIVIPVALFAQTWHWINAIRHRFLLPPKSEFVLKPKFCLPVSCSSIPWRGNESDCYRVGSFAICPIIPVSRILFAVDTTHGAWTLFGSLLFALRCWQNMTFKCDKIFSPFKHGFTKVL